MADHPRIEELRRRIQNDPASLAFGQLAEECRRAGLHQEAIRVCRSGLAHHPDYLSARVTLGRAWLTLGHLDQASEELAAVLHAAPENLAAMRGLAEVHHRRGAETDALALYKRALALAPHDVEMVAAIEEIERSICPVLEPSHQAVAGTEGVFAARFRARLERWLAAIEARLRASASGPT